MAITREGFELLSWARSRAENQESWSRVLTLGRQSVVLPRHELREWERISPVPVRLGSFIGRAEDAAAGEELLRLLGAKRVDSMDTSAYEGANVIHNLNEPVPDSLVMAYDVVFDGGTLEHVFDYPRALANALRMVRPGGWFLAATPTNMWCGHGFYQPGPEIFRMALQPAFGFELGLLAFGGGGYRKQFWICDKARFEDSHRLGINSPHPTSLLIAGHRINPETPAEIRVEQSDYTTRWSVPNPEDPETPPPAAARPAAWRRIAGKAASFLPHGIRDRIEWWLSRRRNMRRLENGLRRCRALNR